jgi:hypothetical protein
VELPTGMVILDVFKRDNYPNLFKRQIHDERRDSDETEELGWRTTPQTRPIMVQQLLSFLRDREIKTWSLELIQEMRTFVHDKTGKPVHQVGEHDDLIFGLMIAIQVHLRCPMDAVPYEYATTGATEAKKGGRGIEYAGGYDTEGDSVDDFDDSYFDIDFD